MKKIIRRTKLSVNQKSLLEGIHPLLAEIYTLRGITNLDEVDYGLSKLFSYEKLKGISTIVSRLENAIINQKKVIIIGDFDVDGATSTVLALKVLKQFGLQNISYLIPNRFEYGYGLSPEIVAAAAIQKPDVIVTVDNGIASLDGVLAAQKLGIEVLITDHHLAGSELPKAAAIVL